MRQQHRSDRLSADMARGSWFAGGQTLSILLQVIQVLKGDDPGRLLNVVQLVLAPRLSPQRIVDVFER